jgi:hypothetical protein
MSKYTRLRSYLQTQPRKDTDLSFDRIEEILGFILPRSAHEHNAWWSNERGTHVQARAWMDAGWRVWHVRRSEKKVYFRPNNPESRPSPAGVAEAAAVFVDDDSIVVRTSAFRGGVMRLLEDYCEANGGDLADAVAAILNGLALERRRQLLERFPMTGAPSEVDSADLIREDRDAR